MERVTKTMLHNMINSINSKTKNTYALDIAYGGYRLVKMCENGGESDCSYRVTAKEMYYILYALDEVLYREK